MNGLRPVLLGFVVASVAFAASGDNFSEAKLQYDHTDFAAAIAKLSNAEDAASLRLLGQSYFMAGELKKASEALEQSLQIDPQNSNTYLWLGRTYGRRAETAFPMAAPALASKARTNLEKAVELDSHNWEAVDDLFDYYLQAPGFLGGGIDKAAKLAELIATHDPAQGSFAQARIAEEHKQYRAAETDLRRAVELAPHQVGRVVDLARFLAKRGRYRESDEVFVKAMSIAPDSPRVVWGRAHSLVETNRNLPEARALLKKYLTLNLSPNDTPRQDAERLLRKVSGS